MIAAFGNFRFAPRLIARRNPMYVAMGGSSHCRGRNWVASTTRAPYPREPARSAVGRESLGRSCASYLADLALTRLRHTRFDSSPQQGAGGPRRMRPARPADRPVSTTVGTPAGRSCRGPPASTTEHLQPDTYNRTPTTEHPAQDKAHE